VLLPIPELIIPGLGKTSGSYQEYGITAPAGSNPATKLRVGDRMSVSKEECKTDEDELEGEGDDLEDATQRMGQSD